MRSISSNFRREYIKGNRNHTVKINMTLVDGTKITLTNDNIWEGGFSFEEGVSSTDSFDIGCAIIGKCTIVIDNIKEQFSTYDFFNATLWVYIGLEGLEEYPVRLGFYTVDETSYNGSLITLNCLDNMWRFDTPFKDIGFSFGAGTTIRQVIQAMCDYSGINVGLATQSFHNYARVVTEPEGDFNCREVLQYLAQICGCYCKMTPEGNLALKWFDKTQITELIDYDGGTFKTTTTPYSDGVELDGGNYLPVDPSKHFVPYDSGDDAEGGTFKELLAIAYLSQNASMQVGTDDIVVTGCRVCTSDPNAKGGYDYLYYDQNVEKDHERYILVFQDNPFVTAETAEYYCGDLGDRLAGTPIRPFTASSLSDLAIEAGDVCAIVDFRGNRYYTWVTNLKFQTQNYESFSCGAQTILDKKTVRYSDVVKTLVEAKRNTQEIVSDYDRAVKNINDLANEAIGYNVYEYKTEGGSTIMWRYSGNDVDSTQPDNPKFPDSNVVFKITGEGSFVSTAKDEQGYPLYTNGYDANTGTALLSLIYTVGLNAEWIKTGTLTVGGVNNTHGTINVLNASGQVIGYWNNAGIYAKNGTFEGALKGATGSFSGTVEAGKVQAGTLKGMYLEGQAGNFVDLRATGMSSMQLGNGLFLVDAYGRLGVNRIEIKNSSLVEKLQLDEGALSIMNGQAQVSQITWANLISGANAGNDYANRNIGEGGKSIRVYNGTQFHTMNFDKKGMLISITD